MSPPTFRFEEKLKASGCRLIAGVDEAGRGPLAGPVVAAAVILPHRVSIKGLRDSKKLSPQQRNVLYKEILSIAQSTGIGIVSERIIDEINILKATLLAMRRAIDRLSLIPDHVLVDGKIKVSAVSLPQTPISGGDDISASIAAASIVAKVTRDIIMYRLEGMFPGYELSGHKGYGTLKHIRTLVKKGPLPVHRRTFQPIPGLLARRFQRRRKR